MLTSTVCVALSAAGLAVALLTGYRRRYLAATRTAALALLPVGLYMTGLITLGGRIGSAVGSWASDLVFKPSVWAGFGALALSVVLFAMTRVAAGRRGVGRGRTDGAETGTGRSAPSLSGGRAAALPSSKASSGAAGAAGDDGLSDFADIEEILKRRGI